MSPEAQRVAIAELRGWRIVNYGPPGYEELYWKVIRPDGTIREHGMTGESFARFAFSLMVPNYTGDSNALAEVERNLGLTAETNTVIRVRWVGHLRDIVSRRMPKNKSGNPIVSDIDLLFAENSERSEALLRTFKKWED